MLGKVGKFYNWAGETSFLARGASVTFIVKIAGIGLGFISQIVLARYLGITEFGYYALALSWIAILALLSRYGMHVVALRFVPVYRKQTDAGSLRGVVRYTRNFVLVTSTMVALACELLLWADVIPFAPSQKYVLMVAMAGVPLAALSGVWESVIQGCRQVLKAQLPDAILRPGLMLTLVLILSVAVTRPLTSIDAVGLLLIANLAALLLLWHWMHRSLPVGLKYSAPVYNKSEWLAVAGSMFFVSGLRMVFLQTGVIALGLMGKPEDVAAYAAASRIVDLAGFGLVAVNSVITPLIAELYHTGQVKRLQQLLRFGAMITTAVTLIASILLVFMGSWVLSLFGAGFEAGYLLLLILLAGQFVNAATGSVGYMLTMTGHQSSVLKINVVVVALSLLLNVLLIPIFGSVGAAVATAFCIAIQNIVMYLFVRNKLGFETTIVSFRARE